MVLAGFGAACFFGFPKFDLVLPVDATHGIIVNFYLLAHDATGMLLVLVHVACHTKAIDTDV